MARLLSLAIYMRLGELMMIKTRFLLGKELALFLFVGPYLSFGCAKDSQRISVRPPKEIIQTPPLTPPHAEKDSYNLRLSAWFSNPEDYTASPRQVSELIRKAELLGVEKIYVSTWRKGCTAFPSKVMAKWGEAKVCPGFDWLTPMLVAAKKSKITLVPWLEWGLHIPSASKLRTMGKLPIIEDEIWWDQKAPRLDPFSPEVISFYSELVLEASSFFGVKEVHLCDNHALKKSQLALKKKTAENFTQAIAESTANARKLGVSLSFSTLDSIAAKRDYGTDWPEWRKSGLVSEVTSELYHLRFNPSVFPAKAAEEVKSGADQLGIYVGAAGNWTEEQILAFIQDAKRLKVGISLFEIGYFVKNKSDDNLKLLRDKIRR